MRAPRLFAAIDAADADAATKLARAVRHDVDGLKLGLEFFVANGPRALEPFRALGLPIFLDLKLHDIPNTVAGAMRAAARLGPELVTVHAAGGSAMLRAAVEAAISGAAAEGAPAPQVIAVTVLTALGEEDLAAVGQDADPEAQALRLARLAIAEGADGVVCAAGEIELLRHDLGPRPLLVVPGLRPAWAGLGDQKRVATPGEAAARGADILVIGRPIIAAADPAEAARRIRAECAVAQRDPGPALLDEEP